MKPYTIRQGSKPHIILSAMKVGVEVPLMELAAILGKGKRDVSWVLSDARRYGCVKHDHRAVNSHIQAYYTLIRMPEVIGICQKQGPKVYRPKSKLKIEPWPIGPCVDLSNKYNLEAFYER